MHTLIVLVGLFASAAFAAPPDGPAPSETMAAQTASDQAAIRQLIREQLIAFERGDAEAAWSPTAQGIRDRFGTPENFLHMVREGYAPLIGPRSVQFLEIQELPTGELGQLLEVVGADGRKVGALYLLEKQADGTWRTSGCMLVELAPAEVAS